eukprot:2118590-Amphidinium_carterae.1
MAKRGQLEWWPQRNLSGVQISDLQARATGLKLWDRYQAWTQPGEPAIASKPAGYVSEPFAEGYGRTCCRGLCIPTWVWHVATTRAL